jgi:hypothetical protein
MIKPAISRIALFWGCILFRAALMMSAHGAAPSAGDGQIRLRSGDSLSGRVEAIRDGGDTLVLRHPLIAEPLAIETAALARFDSTRSPGTRLPRHWQVDLVNGDRFDGRDLEFSGPSLRFESETLGRVSLPIASLRSIARLGGDEPMVDGIGVPGDSRFPGSLQKSDGGGFILPKQGSTHRATLEMPETFRLDMEFRDTRQWWMLNIYSSKTAAQNTSHYSLQRSTAGFQFSTRYSTYRASFPKSVVQVPFAENSTGVISENITILFDRPSQSMRIFLNGDLAASWTGIPLIEGAGNSVSLQIQGGTAVGAELLNFRMTPMSNMPPDTSDWDAAGGVDGVWMGADSPSIGTIETPDEGAWRLRDASGVRDIAVEELLYIAFGARGEAPVRRPGGMRVALRDGSRLSMRITGGEEGVLTGESAAAGAVRLRMEDVAWIDWANPEPGPETTDAMGRLSLTNGDVLRGNILQMDAGSPTLRFRHPAIREEITLGPAALGSYRSGRVLEGKEALWQVDGDNGVESLTGEDLRLEGDILTLWNRYTGKITFPRGQGLGLIYRKNLPVLLRGLNKAGWNLGRKGDPFSAEPSSARLAPPNARIISREIPALPETFRMELEISGMTPFTPLSVLFAASEPPSMNEDAMDEDAMDEDPMDVAAYELSFRVDSLSLVSRNQKSAAAAMNPPFRYKLTSSSVGGERTRYTFFTDLSKRTMWVYVDGKQAAVWAPLFVLPSPGTYFTLAAAFGNAEDSVLISDLLVAEWDGVLPGGVGAGEIASEKDLLILRNLDQIQGKVQSLAAGMVNLQLEDVALDIPSERFKTIRLAERGPRRTDVDSDVALTLTDGSLLRMRFTDMQMDGAAVTGVSPVFGSVQVPADSIHVIRWDDPKRSIGTHPDLVISSSARWAEPGSDVDPPPVSIPFLDSPELLGSLEDVPAHLLAAPAGAGEGDDPEIRLAWNQRGLMVRYRVQDGNIREAQRTEDLFTGTGVELYVAPQRGSRNMIQTIAASGLEVKRRPPRTLMLDYRKMRPNRPALEMRVEEIPGGYVINLFFPWSNLDLAVEQGQEIAVQCFVHRVWEKGLHTRSWHPETGTFQDPNRMRRVILGPPPVGP